MSIASNLSALSAAKTAIAQAIIAKGGALNDGDGFADFSAAIEALPSNALPEKIDFGTFSPASAITFSSGKTLTVPHALGVTPTFLFIWGIGDARTPRSTAPFNIRHALASYNDEFWECLSGYRSATNYQVSSLSFLKAATDTSFTIASPTSSLQWLYGVTYNWLAIAL